MAAGNNAMTEFGRRGGTLPPQDRKVQRLAAFAAAIRSLLERARPADRGRQVLDAARERLFSEKRAPVAIYAVERSEVASFLASCRQTFWGMAAFSGLSNILMLTGSFFMLQVYDRVLPSRSVPTLVALIFLATALYVAQGALDLIRSRISVRIGRHFDETLSHR